MPCFLAIDPEALKRFPVPVSPVMELPTGVVIMGACHCDSLELGLQVVNEALEEFLKSVRFSQVKPGSVRGAHGGGFHGWPPLPLGFVRGTGKAEGVRKGLQGVSVMEWEVNLWPRG